MWTIRGFGHNGRLLDGYRTYGQVRQVLTSGGIACSFIAMVVGLSAGLLILGESMGETWFSVLLLPAALLLTPLMPGCILAMASLTSMHSTEFMVLALLGDVLVYSFVTHRYLSG